MTKQFKLETMDMRMWSGTTTYLDIDMFRFTHDNTETEDYSVQIFLFANDKPEFLEEICECERVECDKDLKRIALNWIFDNVKICAADEISNSCKIN